MYLSVLVSVFPFFPFDVLFRKNWLSAPTGTRTHVSWSLVSRDNHYTTGTHHAGNIQCSKSRSIELSPGDVGSSRSRGIQPIFSEEYVEREKKEKQIPTHSYVRSLSLPHLCFFFVKYFHQVDYRVPLTQYLVAIERI